MCNRPIWDACAFEVVSRLERDFQVIREELLSLLDGWNRNSRETSAGDNASPSGFKEYMGDGGSKDQGRMTTSGLWKGEKHRVVGSLWRLAPHIVLLDSVVFYFYHNFVEVEENFAKCPKTGSILRQLVAADLLLGGMVCFSVIKPGTHIVPHTGPSNMRYQCRGMRHDLHDIHIDPLINRLTCHMGLTGCDGTIPNF